MIPSFATISCRNAGPLQARSLWHSAIVPPTKDGPEQYWSRVRTASLTQHLGRRAVRADDRTFCWTPDLLDNLLDHIGVGIPDAF